MQIHMHMLVIATLGVAVLISAGAMMLRSAMVVNLKNFDLLRGLAFGVRWL